MHKKNISDNFLRIERDFLELKNAVNFNRQIEDWQVSRMQAQNPAIARDILKNISLGYCVPEALIITALKFDCSLKRARTVYDVHRINNKTMIIYAKNFLIHTLKKKGFKIVDIAYILDVSTQTVFNYLKKDCLQ